MRQGILPLAGRTFRNNPTLLQVTGKATAMVRNLNIKTFVPTRRFREHALSTVIDQDLLPRRNRIFREKGHGDSPTIIVAGFVPDATEVVEFQRSILRNRGSIYYVNYARSGFNLQLFHAQLADLIDDIAAHGESPTLLGISFGAGLVLDFIRRNLIDSRTIKGVVLISPVLTLQDLVREGRERTGGVRMLESNVKRIIKAHEYGTSAVEPQIERARRCFLALFETGAGNRVLTRRHLAIREKIMEVVEKTTARGGYERLLAMREFQVPDTKQPVFDGPTLILFSESEENILVPDSPTLTRLSIQSELAKIFPQGVAQEISSGDPGDPVPHASLIFHHVPYNRALAAWFDRQAETVRAAV